MKEYNADDIRRTVKDFVKIVKHYGGNLIEVSDLTSNETNTILNLVNIVGFSGKGFVCDRIYDRSGLLVNTHFPFCVVGTDDKYNRIATMWIDSIVDYIYVGLIHREPLEDDIANVERVVDEVFKVVIAGIPFVPIMITADGNFITDLPEGNYMNVPVFVRHSKDSDEISGNAVGIHKYCGGVVDRKRATEDDDALVCRNCYLRVQIPRGIKTYGELRKWSSDLFGVRADVGE